MLLVVKNLAITLGVLQSNSQSCDQKQHQIGSLYEEREEKRERECTIVIKLLFKKILQKQTWVEIKIKNSEDHIL